MAKLNLVAKLSVIFILLPVLQSCMYYTKQVCTEKYRIDMPNLEGRFRFTMPNKDGTLNKMNATIRRISKGVYLGQDGNKFYVCSIGNVNISESIYPDSPIEGYQITQITRTYDGSFILGWLAIDTNILKARNIPYEMRSFSMRSILKTTMRWTENEAGDDGDNEDDDLVKFLLVDNSKISSEDFVQMIDPLSFAMVILPASSGVVKNLKP